MTDYVRNLTSPQRYFRDEAERMARMLRTQATVKDGVIRWKSNDWVVPEECALLAKEIGLRIDLEACRATRESERRTFAAA